MDHKCDDPRCALCFMDPVVTVCDICGGPIYRSDLPCMDAELIEDGEGNSITEITEFPGSPDIIIQPFRLYRDGEGRIRHEFRIYHRTCPRKRSSRGGRKMRKMSQSDIQASNPLHSGIPPTWS